MTSSTRIEALVMAREDLTLDDRRYTIHRATDVTTARALLATHTISLLIADETIAEFGKLTSEASARAYTIIVAAGAATEDGARAAIFYGADDYVARDHPLAPRLVFAERAIAERTGTAPRRSRFDLVDYSPVGIARIREDSGLIIDANPELCRLLGLRRSDIEGASAQFLFSMVEPASPGHPAPALSVPRKCEPFIVQRPDQQIVRVLLSATRYEDDGWYTLLILHDVTEREQLRQQLVLAERMASLGMLAAGVAHEINNPLSYATTNLQYLGELVQTPVVGASLRAATEAIEEALEGAGRVREIVKQLRDFSRADDAALELVSVEQVIQRALSLVANELRHRARIVTDYGETGKIVSNAGKLGQIVVNLLVNASQAIDGRPADNEIRVSTRRVGEQVQIEVADSGRGIPAANLERIFEPFFTTKEIGVGTGLGLSICHALTAALGGQIEASSAGRGAVFRVTLPVGVRTSEHVRDEASLPGPTHDAARRARILVIDDEPGLGRALRRALARGHDVVPVTSASEALGLLDSGERFDLILCDLMMPDTNGIELFATLQSAHAALAEKVIFITGGAFTPDARSFLDTVSNERLLKPIDITALRRLISDRIGTH